MPIDRNTDNLISFNQLFSDYHKRFIRFANTYVRDLPAAEDIVVESLMYYWENRHSLQEKDLNIPAYILTTIKHKCLNYLRHMQIHDEYSQNIQSYTEWELNTRIATLQACEPYDLFAAEVKEIVQQTLDSLPEKTREIFILSRYEDKSYKEIAEKMGMTTKGVEFHVSKALKAFHVSLKDYFPFFLYFFCKM